MFVPADLLVKCSGVLPWTCKDCIGIVLKTAAVGRFCVMYNFIWRGCLHTENM